MNTTTGENILVDAIQEVLESQIDFDINMNGNRIVNLGYPDQNADAASKQYVIDTFVQTGGGGPITFPSDLGSYNRLFPLNENLDFKTYNNNKQVIVPATVFGGNMYQACPLIEMQS